MVKARVLGPLGILALCVAIVAVAAASASASTVTAPDAPGAMSYFDLARKDCVGTARNTTSKVWFTVADGVLSDTYWPTIDATNVHTLQYLVTDGHSFTDVQTDASQMSYRVVPDPTGMSCTIVASSAAHNYSITTTYITDPGRDAVLMRTSFSGPHKYRLYVRLDPLAGGTGGGVDENASATNPENAGGNSAQLVDVSHGQTIPVDINTNTTTDAVNRNYAVPTYMALESSSGFSSASVGYAGTASDGLNMLDSAHTLTPYTNAPDGHVTLTAEIPAASNRSFTLALGFGTTQGQAMSVAAASVKQNFDRVWANYEAGWHRYDAGLRKPSRRLGPAAIREYYESVNVVKASEDKTFPGAIAAGLASPWGQSVPAGLFTNGEPTYFGSYREEFSRDTYEAFTGLLVAGDIQTAQAATRFLFEKQQLPNGSMPRNSLPNGEAAPDTGGLQLDETSYPILMDWQSGLARDSSLYKNHVIPAADFLVANGPSDGVERWEEQSGYSPSTIAAEIAGLTAAAAIARVNGDSTHAAIYQATADDFARNIKAWTVTTNSPFYPGVGPYFIRVTKATDPTTGQPDPNAAFDYTLNNGNTTNVDQRAVIDAGFLDLVRLGVLPASDPDVQNSIKVVDATIERQTPSGPGFYRYGFTNTGDFSEDGYGDCYNPDDPPAAAAPGQDPTNCAPNGAPWPPTDTGTGHLWPVLNGERGEYEIAAGDFGFAGELLRAMRNMTSGQGLEPEQVWEDPAEPASAFGSDPATASIGFTDGKPAGSASPLTWAQAAYARLALDLSAGRNLETPRIVTDRYVRQGMPGSLPITVTSPTSGASVDTSTETVTGTTTPGATVVAEGWPPTGGAAPIASTTADPTTGDWSLTVPVSFGTTTITVTATLGRSTGYAQLDVINVALPGTTVLNDTDPTGDDNGPGTYQYPTSTDFAPGSFDLTDLKVSQTGTDVYVQVKIANLVNTFGNDFGAQLLDIYVRNPSASSFSTDAAYTGTAPNTGLNYSIASNSAWSERLEAQGFASPIWVNASGTSLGNPQFVVDDPSGTATLILPQSTFGTVTTGWVFTVALTGQDGFNANEARNFTQPAGAFTFGVCPANDDAKICAFNPNNVPNVIDTITPPGVSQDTELDPTLGAVELQGVNGTDTSSGP
jgi:glucoamylase